MKHRLTRRDFGKAAAAAALAASVPHGSARAADDKKTLRFIAQSDLRVLDPVWTTAYITRNHAYACSTRCSRSTPSSRRSRKWSGITVSHPTS